MKFYRLKKSLKIFRYVLRAYQKKCNLLPEEVKQEIVRTLEHLQEELLHRDRQKADEYAKQAEAFHLSYLKKTPFEWIRNFTFSIVGALFIAVIIRTMWFELYEIPTGSMRPTFAEQDRLVVSKTAFGINIPLKKGHIYFNPELIRRNGIVIFTGTGMAIDNVNTLYFYIFPGKKQYIKRLIGKPGDVLYFYGGQLYGIDEYGNDISPQLQSSQLAHIDHVPYIHLNGKVVHISKTQGDIHKSVILKQMNQNVAKLSLTSKNHVSGELLPPFSTNFKDYFELWGYQNYGMARLLTREEATKYTNISQSQFTDAALYMEIIHHPTICHPKIERDYLGRLYPSVGASSSLLPLQERHLRTLFSNLYTARFTVKDGKVFRYGSSIKEKKYYECYPNLSGIPNGTYEFYHGKAYQIFASGITKELPKDHPLYIFNFERIQLLYNLGIEFLTFYEPKTKNQSFMPSRYVYYRHGDLYTMGNPLMHKDDATLLNFIQQEYLRQQNTPSYRPHIPFDDSGAPINQHGEIKVDFIKQYGITIPSKQYLVLGDNYAMSADSRDFGFVPEENIRGVPIFIFYPFGKRFGCPLQAHYPFFNSPRSVIWCIALIAFVLWRIHHHKHYILPVKIK